MHHFATCIDIQWEWIILPATILQLTILLLLLTVWETRRRRLPTWKSSTLAHLLHGRVAGAGQIMHPVAEAGAFRGPAHSSLRDMEKISRKILVRLESKDDDDVALVRTGNQALSQDNLLARLRKKKP